MYLIKVSTKTFHRHCHLKYQIHNNHRYIRSNDRIYLYDLPLTDHLHLDHLYLDDHLLLNDDLHMDDHLYLDNHTHLDNHLHLDLDNHLHLDLIDHLHLHERHYLM